jgi:predicted  nucleic acid-binding Zn-ribbon protein
MANTHEIGQTQSQGANGSAEIARLSTRVQELQDECEKLRQALAKLQAERDRYLKALYAGARATREFEDVDIASLQAMTSGPVEMIE